MDGPERDVVRLVAAARSGDVRALSRLLSVAENEPATAATLEEALAPYVGGARLVGVTGPPGVGKSTATTALVHRWRAVGRRVAVLAIDPSSPRSGGALLGDRVRMQSLAGDAGVYVRSVSARGHLGGLAASTPLSVGVLDAAGYDVVVIETVGVGQNEVDIAALADTTVVMLAPGTGDEIQAGKAGLLEIGDVYVINKADLGGAEKARRNLKTGLAPAVEGTWRPPVLLASARDGAGVERLVEEIDRHRADTDGGRRRLVSEDNPTSPGWASGASPASGSRP